MNVTIVAGFGVDDARHDPLPATRVSYRSYMKAGVVYLNAIVGTVVGTV